MKNKEFITDNIALASAVAIFTPLLEIRPHEEKVGKFNFVFLDNGKVDVIVDRFWRDDLMVSALRYHQELKNLKTRMYDQVKYDK